MCKGSQVSKATLCVQNLKWRTVSDDDQGPKKTFDRLPIEPFLNNFSQLRPKNSNAPEHAKHLSGFKCGNKFEGFTAKPKCVCSRKRNAVTVTIDADSVVMRLYQRIPIPATIFNQQDSIPAIHPFLPQGSSWPSAAGP